MPKDYSDLLAAYRNREVEVKANPAVVYVESVLGCPCTCVMCQTSPTKPRRVSDELNKSLEPFFPYMEVLAIHGGGEPLLGDLPYYVAQSMKHGFVLHMNTTGVHLTSDKADLLLKTRLSIRFSIHAGKAETYARIMGGRFDILKERIAYLVKKSESNGTDHDFCFSYVIMKENIDEVDDFIDLAGQCGIKRVRFMPLQPARHTMRGVTVRGLRFVHSEQYNQEILNQFRTRLPLYERHAADLGITVNSSGLDRVLSSGRRQAVGIMLNQACTRIFGRRFLPLKTAKGGCAAPWIGQMVVLQNGNVLPCCGSNCSLGNIHKSTLGEIWNSRRMMQMRSSFKKGRYPRMCGYCRGFNLDNYPANAFPGVRRVAHPRHGNGEDKTIEHGVGQPSGR